MDLVLGSLWQFVVCNFVVVVVVVKVERISKCIKVEQKSNL